MPSPFPGMDPWLGHPEIFPDLHDRWITYSSSALQAALPPPYYAAIGRRTWMEIVQRPVEPDVNVLRPRALTARRDSGETAGQAAPGAVAVAEEPSSRVVVVTVPREERRETFVEIFIGRGENKRLVTTIELLSPSSKARGPHGRDRYLRKQREILESQVNLIEIDLLRGGKHTTAVQLDRAVVVTGPFDYHVCMSRYDRREEFYVYPVRLQDRLPIIQAPLLPEDTSVALNLQTVLDTCYDNGPYFREVDYAADPPVPPLSSEQTEWAQTLIKAGT